MSEIPYSPKKVDLFYPARSGHFFEAGEQETAAGLCAEMSRLAYCRREPHFSFDREQISKVLEGIGFTCQFFESKGTPDGSGTHCLLAFHNDSDLAKVLAVVAFRGTDASDPTDLLDDAEIIQVDWGAGGRVHSGFAHAFEDVRSELLSALEPMSCKMLYTGHSLGAAEATLLASTRKPDQLFTFGSPRVGNQAFVAALGDLDHRRFVDCSDIVARMPPSVLPFGIDYEHCGVMYYIDRNRELTPNPGDAFMREDRLQAAEEYIVNYAWRTGNVGLRELADHAPINYVTAIAAAATIDS
jgi:hypothetical protein